MTGRLYDKLFRPGLVLCALCGLLSIVPAASASPYDQGVYGANVGYGSLTSMTISLGGNVSFNLAPSGSNFVGSGSHTISVTSTDAVGYSLYVYATNLNMTNGATTIGATTNTTAGALQTNTWGYNTDGSTNYLGMISTPALLKSASGPYSSGDSTTVTYGVLTDVTKASGSYSVSVIYTAVALNE